MPFQSEAQRRFMWAKHPEIAQRWADEYPGQHDLPKHKRKCKHCGKEVEAKKSLTAGLNVFKEARTVPGTQGNYMTTHGLGGDIRRVTHHGGGGKIIGESRGQPGAVEATYHGPSGHRSLGGRFPSHWHAHLAIATEHDEDSGDPDKSLLAGLDVLKEAQR